MNNSSKSGIIVFLGLVILIICAMMVSYTITRQVHRHFYNVFQSEEKGGIE
jgi:hypothetical protein